ncbi:hypothetical protein ACFS5N_09835 [Mucilaginibacter ximonensis]|uniref:Phosphatidylinositol glycan class B n=1 Tax=Mucilaginibacter ximonensis TaxID=538021 RepID=A0ABW5YBJ9_9SPHI
MFTRKAILLAAFFIYTISAVFNNGFYYYDEHYQLIEFAELKSGENKPSDLAWEYKAKIRPAIQPLIAYLFLSVAKAFNVTDPYVSMMGLRFLTAILAVLIISYFIKQTDFLIKPDFKIWYNLLSYFLWFLPFINARFSSESYAGLTFILGLAILLSNLKYKFILTGALLGLSFLFRFQTAFMSLGLILWIIFIYQSRLSNICKLLLGGIAVLTLGFVIDYWYYGQLTATFVNYYIANVVNDVASGYGRSPWYFYLTESTGAATIPLGLLIWVCLCIQLIVNNRNFISWVLLPFLIVHLIVPHKELRFLFPIVNFIPLTMVLSLQTLGGFSLFKTTFKWSALVSVMLIFENCVALLMIMLSPADDEGRANITQKIHNDYSNRKVVLLTTKGANPYQPIPIKQHFYFDKNVDDQPLNLFTPIQFDNNVKTLVVIQADQISYYTFLFEPYKLNKLETGIPDWICYIKTFTGYENHSLLLFEVMPKN